MEAEDDEGAIPLHDACAGGSIKSFQKIEHFFFCKICNLILLLMTISGFTEIVQLLLNRAIDAEHLKRMLDSVDSEGDTVSIYLSSKNCFPTQDAKATYFEFMIMQGA